jgi:hypothetical protein
MLAEQFITPAVAAAAVILAEAILAAQVDLAAAVEAADHHLVLT